MPFLTRYLGKIEVVSVLGWRAHVGHLVLAWMTANIIIRQDPAGNIKPDKQKSTEKITAWSR